MKKYLEISALCTLIQVDTAMHRGYPEQARVAAPFTKLVGNRSLHGLP
jgi:hypothetical protein